MLKYERNIDIVAGKDNERTLPLKITIDEIKEETVICNRNQTLKECKKCGMYGRNGACPPHAPDYNKTFRSRYNHFYVQQLWMEFTKWGTAKQYALKSFRYYVSTFCERMIKIYEPRLNYMIKTELNKLTSNVLLATSYCSFCKPNPCAYVETGKCKQPKVRCFSAESTGIMLNKVMVANGFPELEWVLSGQPMPQWFRKVSLIMTKEPIESEVLDSIYTRVFVDKEKIAKNCVLLGSKK